MRLDGFGIFVNDMVTMIRFYRDVLGFEILKKENIGNVCLCKILAPLVRCRAPFPTDTVYIAP